MASATLFGDRAIVPVVMFHSVGAESLDWIFSFVSSPYKPFESKIRYLKEAGFNFVFWDELYDYMSGKRALKMPAVMLTFDDGYLDNWVNVFPILKKYNVKATIFVTSEFIDPSESPRPTTDDVGTDDDPDIAGFLNFTEMRLMEESGLVDIQSHAKTHTWYYTSNRIVDFWRPGLREYPWMPWNANPERKPFYMRENQESLVPLGTPVYEHGKSLEVVRYLPSPAIARELERYVSDEGGAGFFETDEWREKLLQRHSMLEREYGDECRYESPEERLERVRDELAHSKRVLEQGLSKRIDYICWPGGGYDSDVMKIAREVGYKSWTLGSADQSDYRNVPGADPEQIKRIGSQTRQYWRNRTIGHTNGREFLCTVRRHQGSLWYKWAGRFLRGARIARYHLGYAD